MQPPRRNRSRWLTAKRVSSSAAFPLNLAKQVRNGKERYTVLKLPADYESKNAKQKAGLVIYKAIADATGCQQFVFDWDANFTIGYLLTLK